MMSHINRARIVALVAALFLTAAAVDARPITLVWDAAPSVAGYVVYYGTESGAYTASVDVGNLISWQVDLPGAQYYFAVSAYDTDGNLSPFSLEVGDTPGVALTNPGDQFSAPGDIVTLQLATTGSPVAYSAINLPSDLNIDPVTGRISGVVGSSVEALSSHVVTALVSDSSGHVSSVQFTWTVKTNHAPVITNPGSQAAIAGGAVTRIINAFDPDGDAVTFSADGLPTGLGIDAGTGVISGTVASGAAGTYPVTVAVADGFLKSTVDFVWTVSAPGTLAVDQIVFADTFGSIAATPPFSTSVADETLIAFVTAAQPTEDGVQTALVAGGGLNWTLVTRANTQAGTAEIWRATASGFLSDVTVSAVVEIGGDPLTLTVVTFAGAAGVGASAAANDVTGAPLVSLTTTVAGSLVYGAGNDWDQGVARTPAPDQEIVHEYVTNTADTYWVQRYVGPVAAAGTVVQLNDTDPTTDRWNFAAVEIVPQPAPAPSEPSTVTASPTRARAGTTITATVAHGPGGTTDWVGLFAADAGNAAFQAMEYLNGSQTPPASALTSATLNFVAPTAPGLYNFRLFAGGQTTPVATSNNVLVPSTLTINNVSIVEGNSGTTNAVFTVTLTPASPVSVTVAYATVDGSATAGSDYVATTGIATFPPGTTTQTISVPVNGDTTIEPDETFFVRLSHATSAVIGDYRGKATITNDDFPTLKIGDVAVVEGDNGTTRARFTVTLTPASPFRVTVKYATEDGTATAGHDYVAKAGTLTFPAGATTRTVSVRVNGDETIEPDETFFVNLSDATHAVIGAGRGTGTITNDDVPTLKINDITLVEGNSGTTDAVFTVTLKPASPFGVTVNYATSDGTATAGSDYIAAAGTLTFPAGATTRAISVAVKGDLAVELDETFFVNLSDAAHAVISDGRGRATIVNDDVPALKISDVTVVEGNSGTTNAVFAVTLTTPSPVGVTVKYATANGTATAGSDYIATAGTLTFPAGTTTKSINVSVLGDTVVEPDETFVVNLSAATNATVADAQGVGTIVNDDVAPPVEGRMFGFGTVDEGHTRSRFLFRVSEHNNRDYGRLEFWSTDDRNDDDDNDTDCNGDHDGDYSRNHHNVRTRFESTAISNVTFSDDPAFTPGSGRRPPTLDSVVFTGAGKWNGKTGYTFEVRATDQGEPGRNRDTFSLVVKDSRGAIVASVSGKLDGGNIQSTRLAR